MNVSMLPGVEPLRDVANGQEGVELGDAPAEDRRLVDAEIENRRRDPIQVGELQRVEVGEPQLGADPFEGKRIRDAVADAEADHPDLLLAQLVLLDAGDLVAVPIESKRPKAGGPEHPDEGSPPGVVDPHRRLLLERCADWWPDRPQPGPLLGEAVEHLDPWIGQELVDARRVDRRRGIEDRRAPGIAIEGEPRHRRSRSRHQCGGPGRRGHRRRHRLRPSSSVDQRPLGDDASPLGGGRSFLDVIAVPPHQHGLISLVGVRDRWETFLHATAGRGPPSSSLLCC